MTKNLTKVLYKPDTQSTDEYTVIVNPVEYRKWKSGDTTIPLAEVVDSFTVFHSSQGSQGLLGRPSKQQLDYTFGTSKDVDVVEILLKKGKEQASEGFHSGGGTFSMNATRGSGILDSKGKGLTGI